MKLAILSIIVNALIATSVQAKPLHDVIPAPFHGEFAASLAECRDPDGVNTFTIDDESVNYYEGNDYLLIGVAFWGAMTVGEGSGQLFNGRFTSRSETALLGEHNIRFEIDDDKPNVLLRYPLDDAGEPIAARQVKSVRCPT